MSTGRKAQHEKDFISPDMTYDFLRERSGKHLLSRVFSAREVSRENWEMQSYISYTRQNNDWNLPIFDIGAVIFLERWN